MKNISSTKKKLLLEAFILFSQKPYDQVSYSDLEKATGLSRGAVMYHIKNKEAMFKEAIQLHVFEASSVSSIAIIYRKSLKSFIDHYITMCERKKAEIQEMGIDNMNRAMLYIESSAFFFFPDMIDFSIEWQNQELDIWRKVLYDAINNKEIKGDINVDVVANLFENTYLGTSYAGILREKGYDINRLNEEFEIIYSMIKL